MEPVSIEEIRAMSPEEIREFKRKAVKNMLIKIVLPKIAISVAIAVASHAISKAINDKLDDLDEDDSDESDNEN